MVLSAMPRSSSCLSSSPTIPSCSTMPSASTPSPVLPCDVGLRCVKTCMRTELIVFGTVDSIGIGGQGEEAVPSGDLDCQGKKELRIPPALSIPPDRNGAFPTRQQDQGLLGRSALVED